MATFQKRGEKVRAIIRRANHPTQSKTFANRKLAEQWAMSIESRMLSNEFELNEELKIIAVYVIINRYIAEVSPKKKSGANEIKRLKAFLRGYPQLVNKPLEQFGKKDVIEWRDDRLKSVKSASVARDWSSLSAVFTHAIEEWGLPIKSNPFRDVKKPKNSLNRYRRISDKEIKKVLEVLEWNEELLMKKHYIAWCFLFAIETAMRSGEILKLEWSDINGKIAILRDTKNGEGRAVPLSTEARRLLDLLPRDNDRLVDITDATRDAIFRKEVKKAGLDDLHFHDTRHEAISRMAKVIVNPMDLAKISGHRDLKVLLNVYYNPTNEHLADLLG